MVSSETAITYGQPSAARCAATNHPTQLLFTLLWSRSNVSPVLLLQQLQDLVSRWAYRSCHALVALQRQY
jgi:hypothetical protein